MVRCIPCVLEPCAKCRLLYLGDSLLATFDPEHELRPASANAFGFKDAGVTVLLGLSNVSISSGVVKI